MYTMIIMIGIGFIYVLIHIATSNKSRSDIIVTGLFLPMVSFIVIGAISLIGTGFADYVPITTKPLKSITVNDKQYFVTKFPDNCFLYMLDGWNERTSTRCSKNVKYEDSTDNTVTMLKRTIKTKFLFRMHDHQSTRYLIKVEKDKVLVVKSGGEL